MYTLNAEQPVPSLYTQYYRTGLYNIIAYSGLRTLTSVNLWRALIGIMLAPNGRGKAPKATYVRLP